MSHFSRFWISREKREKEWNSSRETRKILPHKMMIIVLQIYERLYFSLEELWASLFFTFTCIIKVEYNLELWKIIKKMPNFGLKWRKLISHFSYPIFSWEISRIVIPRFLVSHKELRCVPLTSSLMNSEGKPGHWSWKKRYPSTRVCFGSSSNYQPPKPASNNGE